ncbi:hypothetical protein QTL97_11430 [Sporosarcina thermotolerans]|uniref:Uncharacterized protein n=1 Tax=Sporosarcina thermotolerans TaxID=633404 RepID=A0AAW9ABZ6_9BACL|nr:hypothetical protein [Sporosarcina thermotolerans]MDW0117550.1 hypothetical protein [Sporosarcina thermotolerans]WHT49711.1 hypothetical protein QNH10_09580 [Sporosarcina thermotolerans]
MKYRYTIILLSILIISGCSNNGSDNNLKQENEELKVENEELQQEIARLSEVNEELELDLKIAGLEGSRKVDQLTNKITSLQFDNERQKELINRYQRVLKFPVSNTRTISDTANIFSPDQVKVNNQIAGLIVSDIKTEAINDAIAYFIKFTGEFEVKGTIIRQGNDYSFMVNENLESMPHTLWEFERGSIFFDINNGEELRKALGDQLDTLPEDGQLEIVGVFKNYYYNEIPDSDSLPSYAEFVRLISEN